MFLMSSRKRKNFAFSLARKFVKNEIAPKCQNALFSININFMVIQQKYHWILGEYDTTGLFSTNKT